MEFFCYHRDRPGSVALRNELLEEHWSYMDRYGAEMIARGPTLTGDGDTPTGSVHIVGLPDPAAARAFAFDEPGYQAGVYRDVLLRRWRNMLGRTMWDFPGGRAGGNRYLVLGLGSGPAADLAVPPDRKISELSVGEAQRVEILKTLFRGAKILVLDEPTAVLSPPEVKELWTVLRRLRDAGGTIVLITHRLDEVMDLSDTITVMRAGQTVERLKTSDTNPGEIARAMVGREVALMSRQGEEFGEGTPAGTETSHPPNDFSAALEVSDLIVMGCRSRLGPHPATSASTTTAVSERCRVPVLMVRISPLLAALVLVMMPTIFRSAG